MADSTGLILALGSVAALALGSVLSRESALRQQAGSVNEEDALNEGFSILSEFPDRFAASYRTVTSAKGKRAMAGAFLREGGKSTARSLFLDNARIARAFLKNKKGK